MHNSPPYTQCFSNENNLTSNQQILPHITSHTCETSLKYTLKIGLDLNAERKLLN